MICHLQFVGKTDMMSVDIIFERVICMRNRLISSFLAAVMLLAAIPIAYAAQFTDTEGHWAEAYIEEATSGGLFEGITKTEFAPDETMTRAMFVTVLGRLEGVDTELWRNEAMPSFFADVPTASYYAPYVRWAVCNGIVTGMSATEFAPDEPVTREQMATITARYVQKLGYDLAPAADGTVVEAFSDGMTISGWAYDGVEFLRRYAVLNGSSDGKGGMRFLPLDTATRAECAKVFCVLGDALLPAEQPKQPTAIRLSSAELTLSVGQSCYALSATVEPAQAQYHLTWTSSDTGVVTVADSGVVTCVGEGTATVTVYTQNALYASCVFTCWEDLASAGESYSEKCIRLFGEVVEDPRIYYTAKSDAQSDMKQITVPVWDFDKNGAKVTKYMSVTVHKCLAATVTAIFTDIYHGEEQFPIHYLGGWNWAGKSEHTCGTALDLNPGENYYCSPEGVAIVGSYWKPGEDPYSIPLNGEVAQIFAKYGFRQGAYWNSGYRDYMHFSYFGT